MSKIDDLERMLEDAKKEEAQKDVAWIKYVVYFFIFVLMVRGCSGDKNHKVVEQTPIEQSVESTQYYDDTTNNQPNTVEERDKRISTPEEKLESLTGEKIDVKGNTAEEIADSAVTQQDESLL